MSRVLRSTLVLLALFAVTLAALPVRSAVALGPGPFEVTKTADTNDGACDDDCSLREAVVAANKRSGADTIVVPAGIFRLSRTGRGENQAAKGDLDITEAATIRGHGPAHTIVKGLDADRVFEIRSGGRATISGLTVRGGNPGNALGGGIMAAGNLTLRRVVVSSNTAVAGGGIYNTATLSIRQSLITGNRTVAGFTNPQGAGIRTTGPTTIVSSTLTLNETTSAGIGSKTGGGIDTADSSLVVRNSTIVQNFAFFGGGIESTNSTITLANDTIAKNDADGNGGGVDHFSFDGTIHVAMRDTILAGNSPQNCQTTANTLDSGGHNLDTGTTCDLHGTGDRSNVPAGLTSLAANGGPTPTMALTPTSVAVNHGGGTCEATDQRGVIRPQGPACEIGAYEMPRVIITKPTSQTVHQKSFKVAWNAPGARSGSAAFDVRFRRRPIGGGSFGSFHAFRTHTTAKSATFTGEFGFRYCFSARAIDRGGHPSIYGPPRCVRVTH